MFLQHSTFNFIFTQAYKYISTLIISFHMQISLESDFLFLLFPLKNSNDILEDSDLLQTCNFLASIIENISFSLIGHVLILLVHCLYVISSLKSIPQKEIICNWVYFVLEENVELQNFQLVSILMLAKRHYYTAVTFLTRKEDEKNSQTCQVHTFKIDIEQYL